MYHSKLTRKDDNYLKMKDITSVLSAELSVDSRLLEVEFIKTLSLKRIKPRFASYTDV